MREKVVEAAPSQVWRNSIVADDIEQEKPTLAVKSRLLHSGYVVLLPVAWISVTVV